MSAVDKEKLNQALKSKLKQIIKIQSAWRGHRARFITKIKKKGMKVKKKYFLDEEFQETISSSQIFNQNAPVVRKEYIYKVSGGKYTGEWLGGFRHGLGTMQWPDNAEY